MKNKIFLSSMLIMSVAPAMAETFPSNGLMQENTTYTNAATETNMAGVYEGEVNATAEYTDILYNIVAGNYLPGGSEDINGTQCTPGNFCTGLTNATYSESDQGLTSCSTLGDGSYTLSPAGATNGNMCYKTCSASCTNPTAPAHSTNVSFGNETSTGTWNYGSQCNAVAPTCSINFDCVNGYHKRPDLTVAQGVALMKQMAQAQGQDITNVPDSYFEEQIEQAFANWETLWSSLSAAEQGMVTQAIDSVQGHTHNSGTRTVPIWQPLNDLQSALQSSNTFYAFYYSYTKTLDGNEYCEYGTDLTKINNIDCSVLVQQNPELAQFRQTAQNGDYYAALPNYNVQLSGKYKCELYPEADYYHPYINFSSINGVPASSDWGEGDVTMSLAECRDYRYAKGDALLYATNWAEYMLDTSNTKYGPFYSSVQVSSETILVNEVSAPYIDYMCDANTITINWNDVDPEYAGQNGEDTAKYDGDIKTPVKAATKKGQRFKGWRFVDPTKTSLSE